MYIADYLLQEKEEDITVGLTHYIFVLLRGWQVINLGQPHPE